MDIKIWQARFGRKFVGWVNSGVRRLIDRVRKLDWKADFGLWLISIGSVAQMVEMSHKAF